MRVSGSAPVRKEQNILRVTSSVLNLPLPRYKPLAIKGTSLAIWHDSECDQYLVLCPECHELIPCDALDIVYQEMVWSERKCCQGCRAKITFQQNPGLIGLFLDYWLRTGNFPESASWLEAIPTEQFNLWAKAIRAALEADQKKRARFLPQSNMEGQNTNIPPLP